MANKKNSTKKNPKKKKRQIKKNINDLKTKKKRKSKTIKKKNIKTTAPKQTMKTSKKNKKKINIKKPNINIRKPNIDLSKIKNFLVIILTKIKDTSIFIFSNLIKYLTIILKALKNALVYVFRKLLILLLLICKVTLIVLKNIKNFIIKQYNIVRKKKKEKIKIKHKKKAKSKEIIDIVDDEITKLKYRDYDGFAKISVFFINRIRVIKFDMKKFKKRFKYGTFKDKILILLMLGLIAGFSLVIMFCIYIVVTAPEISNERLYKTSSSEFIDINGEVFARRGTENREKIGYEYLPEVLIDAIVSAEDSRFFQHNGIDVARFTKAVLGQLVGKSDAGGGSTLTMQVSKNAATNNKSSGFAGIKRKFQDIYLSVFVFEKNYTKEQIMEFYVNIPYLGAGVWGVEQASKAYFGKSVSDLTLVEAATIAGLFQSPDAYDPYQHPQAAENRRNTILNLMCRHGYITEEERDIAKSIPLSSLLIKNENEYSKYQDFIDTVSSEIYNRTGLDPATTSMKVYTTMDPERQEVINKIMSGEGITVGKEKWNFPNDVAQTGIAVVRVEDGALVAVGASRSTKEKAYNYATAKRMKRHPGSTAKPIIDYGPAIEYLNWGSGTTVIDDKTTYSGGGQIKNFDNDYKGIMTVKTALAQSRNIPALYTFQQTTNEQKLTFANNLNWHPEDKSGYIVESAAIGGFNGVNPLQAAAAYATFARGGTYIEPFSYTKIELTETGEEIEVKPKKVQAMSESTAFIINMILRHAVTSGAVGAGSISGTDLCAKTGTSTVDAAQKKARGVKGNIIGDSWEVAYSPDYAIATWYGYDDQYDPTYHLTNNEGGRARKMLTKYLTSNLLPKNSKFEKPSSVVAVEVELGTDPIKLASAYTPAELRSTEYFKKGYEPSEQSDRFSKLSNPSGASYTVNGNQVTLTWKAANTPNAISTEYLANYFKNSVYATWADKYYQERINYNNAVFGNFGYQIYMTTPSGTTDLGFTTTTTLTTTLPITSEVTFTIKSSYQKFKANQSDGITLKITNQSTNTDTTDATSALAIEFKGVSCVTVDTYNNLGPSPKDKIKVIYNKQDVTASANINATCFDANGSEISCTDMVNGTKYRVDFVVKYNTLTRNKSVVIQPSCN
ncbi:MAG: transglycosylase domain-containing protein [Erysipelotrichales bacterium]|nr:transglycosylase domain-containing protein [Erysipelotrichales bacterium]